MTHITRHISFFVMMILCLNSVIVTAGEKPFYPPTFGPKVAGQNSWLHRFTFQGPSVAIVLKKSWNQVSKISTVAFKRVIEHPKEASALAAIGVLVLLWSNWESIKERCKDSKSITEYKGKAHSLNGWIGEKIDNGIEAYTIFPVKQVLAGMKALFVWLGGRSIAMKSECLIGTFLCPLIGYVNCWTPFAGIFGLKFGCFAGGVCWATGYMGIDSDELKNKLDNVDQKMNNLQETVNEKTEQIIHQNEELKEKTNQIQDDTKNIKETLSKQHQEVNEKFDELGENMDEANQALLLQNEKLLQQYQRVSKNLENLNNQMSGDFAEVKKEIEKANVDLSQQFTDTSNTLTEKMENEAGVVRELLKTKIADVTNQLNQIVDNIKNLASRDDVNITIANIRNEIDVAIAKTIDKFNQLIIDNVNTLDKKTGQKLEEIEEQLKKGFSNIHNQQSNQEKEIKEFNEQITQVINNRLNDIQAFEALASSTKESNENLLEKFTFMEKDFKNIQKSLEDSNEKYDNFLSKQATNLDRILTDVSKVKELESHFKEQKQRIDTLETMLLEMQKEAKERQQKEAERREQKQKEKILKEKQKEEEVLLREKERDKNIVNQVKEIGGNICNQVTTELKKIIADLPTKQDVLTILPKLQVSQKTEDIKLINPKKKKPSRLDWNHSETHS